MKQRQINFFKWLLGGGIICFSLLIPARWIAELITRNTPETFEICTTVMLWFIILAYIIISVVKIVHFKKFLKAHNEKELEETKKELTSEFKTVVLKNFRDVLSLEEMFECQAKIDDNGKIICRIQVDFERKMDSYEEFLRYFSFVKE